MTNDLSSTPQPPRRYRVFVHDPSGSHRTISAPGASAAEAIEAALLQAYGPDRPAMAPGEAVVEGTTYQVDEWAEARVFVVATSASPAERERTRIERTLLHLRRLDDSLSSLAAACHDPADARAARYDAASVCAVAARLRDQLARRGGR